MAAGTHHLIGDSRIQQGALWSESFVFSQGGSPIDLTGYSGLAHIRKQHEDETELVVFDFVLTDAVNGVVTLSLTSVQTAALPACKGVWSLEMTPSGGDTDRYLEGTVEITAEATK